MNKANKLRHIAATVLAAVFSKLVMAATLTLASTAFVTAKELEKVSPAPATAAEAPISVSEGEIRKVDKDAGKITIKHGPLKNLDMPAMTMVFRLGDKSMLDRVKAGDKIKFVADKINGALVVTKIESGN